MEIFYILVLTLIASGVGTISGFGTATIMTPILLIFMSPIETIFFVAIIHLFGDIWRIIFFRKSINWKWFLTFGIPGIIASYFGASLSLKLDPNLLIKILGTFLFVYSLFLFIKPKFKLPATTSVGALGGALSGFFAGITGIGGTTRGAFLALFDLSKAMYIATAGAIGIVVDSTRIITYVANGTKLEQFLFYGLILFIPASLVGAAIGKNINDKIPQEKFRLVIAIFLLLASLKFLIWP